MQVDKFEGADFKYGNTFFKFQSKNTLTRQCGPKFHLSKKYPNEAFFKPKIRIFCFTWKYLFCHIQRCWFQIWQWFFQIPVQKYPSKRNFCSKFNFFFNMKLWILLNSKDVDFKYDMSYFTFSPEYQNKALLIPNLKFFCFTWNSPFWQIRGCWFQI